MSIKNSIVNELAIALELMERLYGDEITGFKILREIQQIKVIIFIAL